MSSKKCSKVNILLNVMNASGGWLDDDIKHFVIGTNEFPNAKSLSNALYQAHARGFVQRDSAYECVWYISPAGYRYLDAIDQKIKAEDNSTASCTDDETSLLKNELAKTIDDRNRFYNECCEKSKQIEALAKKCNELIYENEGLKASLENQKRMADDVIKAYNSLSLKHSEMCKKLCSFDNIKDAAANAIELARKTIDSISCMF